MKYLTIILLLLFIHSILKAQEGFENFSGFENLKPELYDKPDSVFNYTYSETDNIWSNSNKYLYEFNELGLLLNEDIYTWKETNWQIDTRNEIVYNDSAIKKRTVYWWDWFYSEWIGKSKYEFEWDSTHKTLTKKVFEYNEDDYAWDNDSLIIFNYDSLGNLIESTELFWFKPYDDWEYSTKYDYKIDSLNYIESKTKLLWDYDSQSWIEEVKHFYKYNSSNKLDGWIVKAKKENSNDWLPQTKVKIEYNSSNIFSSYEQYIWIYNGIDSIWIEDYKVSISYTPEGNVLEKNYYLFDWDLLVWEKSQMVLNTYNDKNQLEKTELHVYKGNKWQTQEKLIYVYDGIMVKAPNKSNGKLSLYPNPVNDLLFVDFYSPKHFKTLKIIDLNGRVVYSNLNYSVKSLELNVTDLKLGIYMLVIDYGDKIETRKFIKQ